MFIKICGTTNVADAAMSVELGADALGFIFASSKRQVTAEQAALIIRGLQKRVQCVGVFTQPNVKSIVEIVRKAGLTAVQMHWAHDPKVTRTLCDALGPSVDLWQVVGYAVDATDAGQQEAEFARALQTVLHDRHVAVVLLDAVKGTASGGLGQVIPWERARVGIESALSDIQSDAGVPSRERMRLVLAGGLSAENLREATAIIQPWGVDVVSGVEASPGTKSRERLTRFCVAARSES